MRRGLAREDLFTVVHDPFLSDTARYADIVLPAATYLESEDVVRSYGSYYIQFVRQVVPPQGEAWSNRRLAQELARRLGLTDPVFSMDTDGLLRELFRGATGPAAGVDLSTLRDGGPIKLAPPPDAALHDAVGQARVLLGDARRARDCRRCPTGCADPSGEEDAPLARSASSPRRAISRPHGVRGRRRAAPARRGRPSACCTRTTRRRAGCATARPSSSCNEHGAVRLPLRVSDETARGVAFVPGQRPAGEAIGGTINMLCSDRYSDMGEGATYQSTRLDVRAVAARPAAVAGPAAAAAR